MNGVASVTITSQFGFKNYEMGRVWSGLSYLEKGALLCSFEQGKESSNSGTGLKNVDYLNGYTSF